MRAFLLKRLLGTCSVVVLFIVYIQSYFKPVQ